VFGFSSQYASQMMKKLKRTKTKILIIPRTKMKKKKKKKSKKKKHLKKKRKKKRWSCLSAQNVTRSSAPRRGWTCTLRGPTGKKSSAPSVIMWLAMLSI
jgi:hypothetical protein